MKDESDKFLEAYEEYADSLFRYCFFKTSDRETAKDLLQSIFMKTWEYLSHGREINNMKAFLFRTATNLVIDEYRRRAAKKTESLDKLFEEGFEYGENPRERMEDQIDGAKVILKLQELPEEYREAVFMRYVEELSLKEISEITGESTNTLAVRVHRGLKMAKKIFEEEQEKQQEKQEK